MSESTSRIPANTAESTRDVQERIGRFARAVFVIAAVMMIASFVVDAATGKLVERLFNGSRLVHPVAQIVLLAG